MLFRSTTIGVMEEENATLSILNVGDDAYEHSAVCDFNVESPQPLRKRDVFPDPEQKAQAIRRGGQS